MECILKYIILESLNAGYFTSESSFSIKQLLQTDRCFEPLKEHKLDKLLALGSDKNVFKVPKESDFKDVMKWTSEWRYAINHNVNEANAKDFLISVILISQQLKSELEGKVRIREFNLVV